MRYPLYAILGLLLLFKPALADDRNEVQNLLRERIDAVFLLLQDEEMERRKRDDRIVDIVRPIFDFKMMAKLSLGKKYWPGLKEEKRSEFSDLFTERLEDSYLEKLDLYTDEEILYEEPLQVKKKIHIPTTLISKDSKIAMLYKFYRSKRGWLIYDLEIGGVSVIQTYRSQFDGVLKKGTIDDLLEKLKTDGEFLLPEGNADAKE